MPHAITGVSLIADGDCGNDTNADVINTVIDLEDDQYQRADTVLGEGWHQENTQVYCRSKYETANQRTVTQNTTLVAQQLDIAAHI